MAKQLEELLSYPLEVAESIRKLAKEAKSFRQDCADLNAKVEKLSQLLRSIARLEGLGGTPPGHLYIRPLHHMLHDLQKSLSKALILVKKCRRKSILKRLMTITSLHNFKRVSSLLDNSVADVTWFLSISASGSDGIGGMPPIASAEPLLGCCWEHIALLHRGTEEEKEDAAGILLSYARNNEHFIDLLVEEEAIVPLLKLLQEGSVNASEAAARLLGLMIKDVHVVKEMIRHGAAMVFIQSLGNTPMKVQAAVAWTLAEILDVDRDQQGLFLEEGIVRPLVTLLNEFFEEESNRAQVHVTMQSLVADVAATKASMNVQGQQYGVLKPSVVNKPGSTGKGSFANGGLTNGYPGMSGTSRQVENRGRALTQREINRRERETADPQLKAELKAEAARALGNLAKDSPLACKSITETKALLCLATLMEKSSGTVQLNAARAVMEIACVAEHNADLKRTAFKMSTPAAKAVVEQLLRLLVEGSLELRVVCIKAIGYLSHTFSVKETRVVKPLVKQLEVSDEVTLESLKALVKFACEENFLHKEHSREIVEAQAAPSLVELILFGKGEIQWAAVELMCHLALHAGGESKSLAQAIPALKTFAKNMSGSFMEHQHFHSLDMLLSQAIKHLQIYDERVTGIVSNSDSYNIFS